MIAAGKEDLREWFIKGVERGARYMLIVFDRMEYLDGPDSPYYADSIGRAYSILHEFNSDPMCEVMEVYDLSVDMEAQLAEKRAWRLPGKPEVDDTYPAKGLLSSGKTRLSYMETKNKAYMTKYFGGTEGVAVHDSAVFADYYQKSVNAVSAYLLEKVEPPSKTAATVYLFDSDGGARAFYIDLFDAWDDTTVISVDKASLHEYEPLEKSEKLYITFELWFTVKSNDGPDNSRTLFVEKSYSLKHGSNRFGSKSSEMRFIDE